MMESAEVDECDEVERLINNSFSNVQSGSMGDCLRCVYHIDEGWKRRKWFMLGRRLKPRFCLICSEELRVWDSELELGLRSEPYLFWRHIKFVAYEAELIRQRGRQQKVDRCRV